MKRIFRPVLLFIVCSLFYLSLFQTGLFQNLVLFYRGIVFLIVSSLVYWVGTSSKSFTIVFFCVHMMFFTLVPVTLDRSISVFMLHQYQLAGEDGLSEHQMEALFLKDYMEKNHALSKRYTEQLQSKTIQKTTSGYGITPWGTWIVRFFSIVGSLYALK